MDRDTRESYIIAKRSQRCTPRTGRDARETHRSRCIAKDKYIYMYILKGNSREKRNAVEFDLMDEGIDDGEIVSFVFRGRRSKALSSDSLSIFE